ncbi:MAG: hypothetical protein ACJ8C4_06525 [Gemmataceae bacterium]
MSYAAFLVIAMTPMALSAPDDTGPQRLRMVVDNVRAAELLYGSVDIEYRREFATNEIGSYRPGFAMKRSVTTVHLVKQDSKYRVTKFHDDSAEDGRSVKLEESQSFDGEQMRQVMDRMAHVIDGKYPNGNLFFPHGWLMANDFFTYPLSVFLEGGDTLNNFPTAAAHRTNEQTVVCNYEHEDTINGELCDLVQSKMYQKAVDPKNLLGVKRIWLAKTKNMLPLRVEGYAVYYSKDLPIQVSEASQLFEVSPSVWLPKKLKRVIYDELPLIEGKQNVNSTTEWTVTKASLQPEYPDSFFSDLPMKDGTVIYYVKNGKNVRKEIYQETSLSPSGSWPWWLVGLVATMVAVALLGVARRASKKKPRDEGTRPATDV